jgi:hypothetical protein
MLNEQTKLLIEQYLDRESDKTNEPYLFELLSKDEGARNYFNTIYNLKRCGDEVTEEYPYSLDSKILNEISYRTETKWNLFGINNFKTALAYSFAVVMLIITIVFYYDMSQYKYQLNHSIEQINSKQKEVELLLNSIPVIQVRAQNQNALVTKANL